MTPNVSGKSRPSNSCPLTCQVEAILSMDARGQIVLPKDVRKKAGIRDGDTLALVSWMKEDVICCFALIQTNALSSGVSGVMHSFITEDE